MKLPKLAIFFALLAMMPIFCEADSESAYFTKFLGKSEKAVFSDPKIKQTDSWTVGMATKDVAYGVQGIQDGKHHAFLLVDLSTPAHTVLDVLPMPLAEALSGQDCRNDKGDSFSGHPRVSKGLTRDAAVAKIDSKKVKRGHPAILRIWVVNALKGKLESISPSGFSCVEELGED